MAVQQAARRRTLYVARGGPGRSPDLGPAVGPGRGPGGQRLEKTLAALIFLQKRLALGRILVSYYRIHDDALPTDPAELQRLLLAERRAAHALTRLERDAAKARLQALIKRYFGRSSETLDENQLKMAWAAVEADLATGHPRRHNNRRGRRGSPRSAGPGGWRTCRSWRRWCSTLPPSKKSPPTAPPW